MTTKQEGITRRVQPIHTFVDDDPGHPASRPRDVVRWAVIETRIEPQEHIASWHDTEAEAQAAIARNE